MEEERRRRSKSMEKEKWAYKESGPQDTADAL